MGYYSIIIAEIPILNHLGSVLVLDGGQYHRKEFFIPVPYYL